MPVQDTRREFILVRQLAVCYVASWLCLDRFVRNSLSFVAVGLPLSVSQSLARLPFGDRNASNYCGQ